MPTRLVPVDVEYVEVDPDAIYEKYLKTCAMNGVEPVPRNRAFALIQEYSEAFAGRPDPTQQ